MTTGGPAPAQEEPLLATPLQRALLQRKIQRRAQASAQVIQRDVDPAAPGAADAIPQLHLPSLGEGLRPHPPGLLGGQGLTFHPPPVLTGRQVLHALYGATGQAPASSGPAPVPPPTGTQPAAAPTGPAGEAPQPHLDLGVATAPASDGQLLETSYQISLTIKDLHAFRSRSGAIEILSDPSLTFQMIPQAPTGVFQAAVSLLNLHLRSHGADLAQLALMAQGSINSDGSSPTGTAQIQATVPVGGSRSLVLSTGLNVMAPIDLRSSAATDRDPSQLELHSWNQARLTWSVFSLGMSY